MANRRSPPGAHQRRPSGAAGLAVALALAGGFVLPGPAGAACPVPEAEPATVADVRDARTLALADGRLIRPAGIESFALIGDDPEAADGLLAERLAAFVAGRPVRLHVLSDRPDRYGRRAALIADDAGLVQARLAADGAAVAVPDGEARECIADILAAEETARRALSGRWASASVRPAEPGALSPHLGGYVIFEGTVLTVGNRTRRTYLNFGRRWTEDVTVVIDAADRERFGGAEALAALAGRRVRVRGFVEDWGGPMVAARWPGQIEALAPPREEGNGS